MTEHIGENVTIEVTKDGKAVITIDLTHRGQPSASGKSITVASTRGNQQVPGSEVTIGINAYVRR